MRLRTKCKCALLEQNLTGPNWPGGNCVTTHFRTDANVDQTDFWKFRDAIVVWFAMEPFWFVCRKDVVIVSFLLASYGWIFQHFAQLKLSAIHSLSRSVCGAVSCGTNEDGFATVCTMWSDLGRMPAEQPHSMCCTSNTRTVCFRRLFCVH